jgi:TRAP-type mannitol/chloroaromatic compound transport system permease small subunit
LNRVVFAIERISHWAGKTFGWCILILTLAIAYEVFARYLFRAPTEWAFDVSYMLYGALFMMAGAYTLSRGGHVRGDFLYRTWPPRVQAAIDIALFVLFFFPGIIALIYAGYEFAKFSYMMNERSHSSPRGPIIYPFKMLIPVAGLLMFLQGLGEVLRCVICLRTGAWPQRLHDVEELEKVAAEQALHRSKSS